MNHDEAMEWIKGMTFDELFEKTKILLHILKNDANMNCVKSQAN